MISLFALLIGLSSTFAASTNGTPSAAQAEVTPEIPAVETVPPLDTRIQSLQSTKTCINNAKSKSDIDQCRRSIVIKRDRIKTH